LRLLSILDSLSPWRAVSFVDLNNIEEKFKNIEDWDNNIRVLKFKRKELEKIQDFYKVDCFNVNAIPFKNQIDDHL
jgi:dynein heavy chain 2